MKSGSNLKSETFFPYAFFYSFSSTLTSVNLVILEIYITYYLLYIILIILYNTGYYILPYRGCNVFMTTYHRLSHKQ